MTVRTHCPLGAAENIVPLSLTAASLYLRVQTRSLPDQPRRQDTHESESVELCQELDVMIAEVSSRRTGRQWFLALGLLGGGLGALAARAVHRSPRSPLSPVTTALPSTTATPRLAAHHQRRRGRAHERRAGRDHRSCVEVPRASASGSHHGVRFDSPGALARALCRSSLGDRQTCHTMLRTSTYLGYAKLTRARFRMRRITTDAL
jgi:hypothetical protein